MKKIPNAEKLRLSKYVDNEATFSEVFTAERIEELMIEFAKLHVEACKEEVVDTILDNTDDCGCFIKPTEKDILNSYPLENIK